MLFNAGLLGMDMNSAGLVRRIIIGEKERQVRSDIPFIRLISNGEVLSPESCDFHEKEIVFRFAENISVVIRDLRRENYMKFEVGELNNDPEIRDIEFLLWGPFFSEIGAVVGEIVGVVRDNESAFGIQALNRKTIGGWPENWESAGVPTPRSGEVREEYRDCAAWPLESGSILQAFCGNYTRRRVREVFGYPEQSVGIIPGADGRIVGSAIALFSCRPDAILDFLEEIELTEGLPHPLLKGEWNKRSRASRTSYMITDFTQDNFNQAASFAQRGGFEYLYNINPWISWGQFQWAGSEQNDSYISRLKDHELKIGAHTLTNFIQPHDSWVSPVPSDKLLKAGSTRLLKPVNSTDEELWVESGSSFRIDSSARNIKCLVVDDEIIRYRDCLQREEGVLLSGCLRGYNNTTAENHDSGAEVHRLWNHFYDVYFPNVSLQDEMAENLGMIFNRTGMKQISFDGLEGCRFTGHHQLGMNRFVDRFFDVLQDDREFVSDASRAIHYLWHVQTRMNWGEPWGEEMRRGQMDLRYRNQRFFQRNLIPPMLGWFNIKETTPLIDVEWMCSKAAGFDSGFAFYSTMTEMTENGGILEILESVKEWETARMADAFTTGQKRRLRNRKTEWHLEKGEKPNSWRLHQLHCPEKPLVKKFNEFQTGSGGADWDTCNPFEKQSLKFELRVLNDGVIRNPSMMVENRNIQFPVDLKSGEILVYNGESTGTVFDSRWNKLSTVEIIGNPLELRNGQCFISFSAGEFINPEGTAELKILMYDKPEDVFPGNTPNDPGPLSPDAFTVESAGGYVRAKITQAARKDGIETITIEVDRNGYAGDYRLLIDAM